MDLRHSQRKVSNIINFSHKVEEAVEISSASSSGIILSVSLSEKKIKKCSLILFYKVYGKPNHLFIQ